ncbi:MAG TPA: NAD(P)H-hydrate dehydratase [Mycobacteriales bacterium]|nr:NAD(P)H-hydrate dehydratase [Mycobacteriales bacterium]
MDRADVPVLTPHLLRGWPLPEAQEGDDKQARGTVLVLGGDATTPGSVLLAGLAALRVGAGRLQIATAPETAAAVGVAAPEAKVMGVALGELGDVALDPVAAVLVGPGLLSPEETAPVLARLLGRLDGLPIVVDAVALLALDGALPSAGVLTPNLDELRALAGSDGDDRALAVQVARERRAVVATLGWVAAADGRLWRNEAGSVALATSGSGDVLAGVVAGLLARGADACQAACWATYLHSAAGDRLAETLGTGFLARELLDVLPLELVALAS